MRLNLTIKGKKGQEKEIKFNIAPSKQKGFINFINQVLKQGSEVNLSFEKISKSKVESSKIEGTFNLSVLDDKKLKALTEEIMVKDRQRKKQQQKRKHKSK